MATTIWPNQEPVAQSALPYNPNPNPNDQQAFRGTSVSSSASASSGSIGPFLVVISVLTVLALVSCYVGRRYSRRSTVAPLERIDGSGSSEFLIFRWLRRKMWRCDDDHSDLNKTMASDDPEKI